MAYSPLGSLGYVELDMATQDESVLDEILINKLAKKYGKTAAQVVLRWGIQRGTVVIPKSTKLERLLENLDIFDFELNSADLEAISQLNKNRRYNDPATYTEEDGYFHPIFD